jgi:protein-disulfide isomerase
MKLSPSAHPAAGRPSALPVLALLAALGLAVPACAAAAPSAARDAPKGQAFAVASESPADILAEVAGQKITRADVEKLVADQLAKIELERKTLIEKGLDYLMEQKLLEAEAAARKVSVDDLIKAEIDDKAGQISDEDAKAFYDANKARIKGDYATMATRMKQYLSQQKRQELRDQLVESLRAKYPTKNLLPIDRVAVAEAGSPAKGPSDAPVTVIEFSDFECPFCGRIEPTLAKIEKNYGDQIRFVFRQFPLSVHPHAQKAAEASLCADEQGKFWEMHDAMFDDQHSLGVEQLRSKAASLGLDADKFNACLDGDKFNSRIQADIADGQKAGVGGTPALFVNGRFINGAVPYDDIAKVIDDELARKGGTPRKVEAE